MFKKVFSFIFILLLTGCRVRDAKIMVRDEKLRYGCCVVGNKIMFLLAMFGMKWMHYH